MASYIASNLTNNERIIKTAKVSWWSQSTMIFFGILTLATAIALAIIVITPMQATPIVALGLMFIATAAIRVMTTELAITNKLVIAKTGFIRRDTIEIRLERVEGITISQSITGRMLNYGTIIVSGTGGIETPIHFINKPSNFRKALNEVLEPPEQNI